MKRLGVGDDTVEVEDYGRMDSRRDVYHMMGRKRRHYAGGDVVVPPVPGLRKKAIKASIQLLLSQPTFRAEVTAD